MVDFCGKTVLVTGGTGFIGGRLAERLHLECHARVRVLVHQWTRAAWIARYPVELVPGEITEPAAVRAAVRDCAIVFHCASGGTDSASYFATNVAGTRCLLEAAGEQSLERFVHVSSAVVHGLETDGTLNESSPFRPSAHPYTASKIKGEETVWEFARRRSFPVTVIRPAFVWGPRGSQFTVGPVQAMAAGRFALVDHGRPESPTVYVDHLVDALLLAAADPRAIGEAFLIADDDSRTWRDFFGAYAAMLGIGLDRNWSSQNPAVRALAAFQDWAGVMLGRLAGNPAPLWRRAVRRSLREVQLALNRRGLPGHRSLAMLARRGGISSAKIREVLGFHPRRSLAEAMAETEIWLRDQFPHLFRRKAAGPS